MNYTDAQMLKAQRDYQEYKIPIKVTLKKFKKQRIMKARIIVLGILLPLLGLLIIKLIFVK